MAVDLAGLFAWKPLLAHIIVVSHQFLFLGVNGNDRQSLCQTLFDTRADMAELGVPVLMILALLGLAIALQTEMLVVEDLGDFDIADRMVVLGQLRGQCAGAFANPAQGGFRVAVLIRLFIDTALLTLR